MIGRKKAFELLLSGETISAQDALDIGLVNTVVSSERFEEEVQAFISKLTAHSSVVLRMTKKALVQGWDTGAEEALKVIEDIYMNKLMRTEDANEGLAAFLEKRKPVWKGR